MSTTAPDPVKVERMSFGRWMKTSAGATPSCCSPCCSPCSRSSYIINLAFSQGSTLTSACPLDPRASRRSSASSSPPYDTEQLQRAS